ncbi:MAG: nitroreductase [Archangium gephyra]|uniref:Nitroreductase n=1 Tax=Archangium gephyra TaxID=48 RepID=A0A2W5STA4_9BACT|nr:MAG: nitroreductase [Archangium gephyra]
MTNRDDWQVFRAINARRRAVRDFDGRAIDLTALEEIVAEAVNAPSSGNLQPYRLHVVHEPKLKAAVAEACNGQRAAKTSSALIVVAASQNIATASLAQLERAQGTIEYYAKGHKTLRTFFRFAPAHVFGVLTSLVALFLPVLSLLPFGRGGVRQWLARNSVYAAQTLMLAASARGFDTCPMEGFDARKVSRLLRLPRGTVIPLVIAIGHRAHDARIEPRVRRSLTDVLVTH